MELSVEKKYIEEIPVLVVTDATKKSEKLPTVVYYHGFNGEKESSLTLAYKIAEKGLRVILPESILHGERRNNATQGELELGFWKIVLTNIKELQIIKNYLEKENLLLDGKIGIGGTSMGGITTYGALRTYDWISSAAVLMGTPSMSEYAQVLIDRYHSNHDAKIPQKDVDEAMKLVEKFDITKDLSVLNDRPLFIWHGDQDAVIPIDDTRNFYKKVKEQYSNKDHVHFLEEKGRIHNISKLSMSKAADWFEKYL
ncbi:dienelactone hydrolase family protein [Pseudogracilibacillus sp. ICA-222130]|uniref:dienelactone hydrolase family protein n=1 Tax=Pseudogracilibacillus sp. ICA-222130 TaxID=3134655 RepID=UPI0030C2AA6F